MFAATHLPPIPCGDPGCACAAGAACDHRAGRRVRPPEAFAAYRNTHDRPSTGGVPWGDLPAVRRGAP